MKEELGKLINKSSIKSGDNQITIENQGNNTTGEAQQSKRGLLGSEEYIQLKSQQSILGNQEGANSFSNLNKENTADQKHSGMNFSDIKDSSRISEPGHQI